MTISLNLHEVWQRINIASSKKEVSLVAVSKFHQVSDILEAYEAGQRIFGESYVQEWLKKDIELKDKNIQWHFIGHLQTNKVKYLNSRIKCIHSVNRESLVKELEKHFSKLNTKIDVFLELQMDENDSYKHGASYVEAVEVLLLLKKCSFLKCLGFMGMPPASFEGETLENCYSFFVEKSYEIWKKTDMEGEPLFSMGMSDDLEIAIKYGSSFIRIGTAIFGKRY